MDLPPAIQRIVEGGIDPYSQHLVEWYSQVFLCVLVAISFIASYFSQSVILGLEIFAFGFVALVVACVPPWPYLNRYKINFLPVRAKKTE